MIQEQAFELVQQYVNGWKQNDIKLITSCLAENCIVIESHGPTYRGIHDIEQWFKFWINAKSEILNWDIHSSVFCKDEETAFFEWDFACVSNAIKYNFLGISVVQFSNHKIAFIHEYRMTQSPYQWGGNKLISE